MRSNKCISPLMLNGRSMADMKTMGMLAQCKKSRDKITKEDYEQVYSHLLPIAQILEYVWGRRGNEMMQRLR